MDSTFAGKTVLVTGGNRGLGRALVDEALRSGAKRVYAGTRRPFSHPDERVVPVMLDVTDEAQIRRAVGQVESLDLLINNAGVAIYDDLTDRAVLEQHLAVNLFGPWRLTQAFLPLLTRTHGAVVNVLSTAAAAAVPLIPSYSVSKAASLSLSQSLRALLAARGVSVHAVLAGRWTPRCRANCRSRRHPPSPSRERSSRRCAPARRTSSRIRCRRPSRRAGAPGRSRRWSARTRRWWRPRRSRREGALATMTTTTTHQIAFARGVPCRPRRAARAREGTHPDGRRAGTAA